MLLKQLSRKDDTYGLTPLHYAVKKGNVEAVLDLITYSDINIEVQKQSSDNYRNRLKSLT